MKTVPFPRLFGSSSSTFRNNCLAADQPLPLLDGKKQPVLEFSNHRTAQQNASDPLAFFKSVAQMNEDFEPTCPITCDEPDFHESEFGIDSDDLLYGCSLASQKN